MVEDVLEFFFVGVSVVVVGIVNFVNFFVCLDIIE